MILVHPDLMLDCVDLVRQHATGEADHEDHEQTAEHDDIRMHERLDGLTDELTDLRHHIHPACCTEPY